MAFWFNNFQEFERKQNEPNRLILNFYYCPNEGEKPRSVKVFVPHNIVIPTKFLVEEKLDRLKQKLQENDKLSQLEFKVREIPDSIFSVGQLEMPYDRSLIKELGQEFQVGNYDKLLKLGGFFPERKVQLSPELEQRFRTEDEIELESFEGIEFTDFPNEYELRALPYAVTDIEKPLWKRDKERPKLEERERLLKLEKKYEKLKEPTQKEKNQHYYRRRKIRGLEKDLMYNTDGSVEGIGEIPLYDERFDSEISFSTSIWGQNGEEQREVYFLDPNDEFGDEEFQEWKGYTVLRFKTEKELVEAVREQFHNKRPAISYGQNEVYDMTQFRYASEAHKQKFDPMVKEVQIRRDFVRKFWQRLKQDMIFFDTMWMNSIFKPYLKQRSLGTNLKLEGIATSYDVEFEKSLTHEELRDVELRRLAGKTPEIRKQAMREMLNYAVDDVEVTNNIVREMKFFPFFAKMKELLPFSTLSEIAFSTNCMNKLHDYIGFLKASNLPYHKYSQKEREDQLQIFKKRFKTMKNKRLNSILKSKELSVAPKGTYKDVYQFYLPLEEWTKDLAFSTWPKLRKIFLETGMDKDVRLGYSQYLKEFMKGIFTDYYFARREDRLYKSALNFLGIGEEQASFRFSRITERITKDEKNQLLASFRYLKNHFRSIYKPLNGKGRALIRPTIANIENLQFPSIMEKDADLYLLRKNKRKIRKMLSSANKRNLDSFLHNFERFEELRAEIAEAASDEYLTADENTVYAYLQENRAWKEGRRFAAKYNTSIDQVRDMIVRGYEDFANNLAESGGKLIEQRVDYVFVQGVDEIPGTYLVRKLDSHTTE